MNVWHLMQAGKLVLSEEAVPAAGEGKLKVRITKTLLSSVDAALFRGEARTAFPIVPGRFAVGIVAEDFGDDFPKGTRVAMHSFLPARDSGTAKKDFSEYDYEICGQTCDGYLRDIVCVSPDEVTALPDSVGDEQALLLHHVALAKAAVERLGAHKGQHVAVVGASPLGILVCQLLIYQQAAPVLIDTDSARLNFARGCGVYYTVQADENMLEQVGTLTGGRLTDGAVYITDCDNNDPAIPFAVSARDSNVVAGGLAPCKIIVDFTEALRKRITVHCVSDCADYLETAINLTANKAVDMSSFEVHVVMPDDLPAYVEQRAKETPKETSFSYTYAKLL